MKMVQRGKRRGREGAEDGSDLLRRNMMLCMVYCTRRDVGKDAQRGKERKMISSELCFIAGLL